MRRMEVVQSREASTSINPDEGLSLEACERMPSHEGYDFWMSTSAVTAWKEVRTDVKGQVGKSSVRT